MKRTIPMVFIGLGVLLLLGSGWFLAKNVDPRPLEVSLPGSIAGVSMTGKTSGQAAVSEIEDLHGKEFPIAYGSIGMYGGRQAMLWVAGADSPSAAAGMVLTMRDKITGERSPFTPVSELEQGGRVVYALDGMGQKHYYFQSKNLVIWLSADPSLADRAIEEILEVYP